MRDNVLPTPLAGRGEVSIRLQEETELPTYNRTPGRYTPNMAGQWRGGRKRRTDREVGTSLSDLGPSRTFRKGNRWQAFQKRSRFLLFYFGVHCGLAPAGAPRHGWP